jgi:hypothetical protein
MANKKQTAVEWLIEQFNLQAYTPHNEQAKAMEKEQIIDAYYGDSNSQSILNGEQYYNENYK